MSSTVTNTEADGRLARPEERVDLDAGYGPLLLAERRRDLEASRSGGLAMGIGSLLQGISGLR